MARINTNVSSLVAQRVLRTNQNNLNTSLERLSTGLSINKGSDNPAGLIASENLRTEKAGITQAIDNAGRASNIIGTAEGGLNEVSSLLTQLQGLVGQAANSGGLSTEEVSANQLQVDSILGSINRIAGATAFQGKKLLDGNLGYTTSGTATSAFDSIQVNAARLPSGNTVSVVIQVTNSATTGRVAATGTGTGGSAVTLRIAGALGTEQLSFAGSSTFTSIGTAINSLKDVTGVSATVTSAGITFSSTGFGSDQFVSVNSISGSFTVTGGVSGKDFGSNAVVTVNGSTAETSGKRVTYRTSSLDLEFDASAALNGGQSKTIGITGGGADFSLSSKVTESGKASLGINAVGSESLGDNTLGFLSSLASGGTNSLTSGNLVKAQRILDKSVKQVSELRGRLGAFQKFTLGSTINSLGVAFENASAAESAIRDTDFAEETAKLTRSQILSQAASTVLSQANSSPQLALQLLRG